MRMVSMGVMKSDRISQLTGSARYVPAEAISLTFSNVGTICMFCTSK